MKRLGRTPLSRVGGVVRQLLIVRPLGEEILRALPLPCFETHGVFPLLSVLISRRALVPL
jgi:hypothetical protein